MRNWRKLAFVALLVATIVWGITLYLVLKEYNEFVEARAWRRDYNFGVIYVGLCLLLAWAPLIASYLRSRRERKAEKLELLSEERATHASWTRVLLYLILIVGCGSILTLVSCFYVRGYNEDLLYWVEVEHEALMFGFPAMVFHSYAIWGVNQMSFVAEFRWEGALIDVALYSVIVGAVFPFLWIIRLFRKS